MDNEKINKIEETGPEIDKCSGNCDDNCKIKNKAFLNYQYRPTQIATDPVVEKSGQSSVVSVCLDNNRRNPKFKMFKLSCKEATEPGDVILYKVGVVNTGNTPLNGVTLVDDLDNDTSYIVNSASVVRAQTGEDPSVPFTVLSPGDPLRIRANQTLPVGEMFIFSYKITVDNALENNTIRNNVSVTTTEAPTPQTDFVEIPANFARVAIAKAVFPANTNCVRCGDDLTYRITLTHTGTIPAINVVVTDLFDPEFCFDANDVTVRNKSGAIVTMGITKTVVNGLLTLTIASLPVGEIYTITIAGEICCCND